MTLDEDMNNDNKELIEYKTLFYTSKLTHLIEEDLLKNMDARPWLPRCWLTALGRAAAKVMLGHCRSYVNREEVILSDMKIIMKAIDETIDNRNISTTIYQKIGAPHNESN